MKTGSFPFVRKSVLFAATLLLAAGAASSGHADGSRQAYKSPDLDNLPYSAAVRAGNMIYVSGVTGHVRGEAGPVPGGAGAEADQALAYIQETLEEAGSSMDRVVKCMVLINDLRDFPPMNAAYRKYFPKDPPARSTIVVPALPAGNHIEIECDALAGD